MIPDERRLEDDPHLLDWALEGTPLARYQHQLRLLDALEERLDLEGVMVPAVPCPDCGRNEAPASDFVRTLRLLATASHIAGGGLAAEAQAEIDGGPQ